MDLYYLVLIIISIIQVTNGFIFSKITELIWGCNLNGYSFKSLKNILENNVVGQDIAVKNVLYAVNHYLNSKETNVPLSFMFTGDTGTGKSYLANLLAKAIHGESKEYVKFFSSPINVNFEEYSEKLVVEMSQDLRNCPNSVFIIDDSVKTHSKILNVIENIFNSKNELINGKLCNKCILIFASKIGEKAVNSIYQRLHNNSVSRDDMNYFDFETPLIGHLNKSYSTLINPFITIFVPFLPMETTQVIECIKKELIRMERPTNDKASIELILKKMEFNEHNWSLSGCKRVADYVANIL